MANSPRMTVRNNAAAAQYELVADGAVIGLAQYQERPGQIAFVHTEIAPEVSGQGLGQVLVSAALDDARSKGLAVLPYCSFVRHYVETHPQYQDLVPPERRPAFGLPLTLPDAARKGSLE
ncbi:MAG: N-acetyltransferase [Bifidobacteriaceae bacterium]|jgi:predicted GNAT family acetyltransferase|nr:N-acetyltransferase [Bifidobacteriaceae bacterium]